jgi:hypothetical protein
MHPLARGAVHSDNCCFFFFFAGFHGFLQGRYIVSKALQFVQDRDTFLTSEQYVHKSYETFFPLSFLQF